MAQVDDDAKHIKALVENSQPKAILVATDGSIHSHPTNSLAWLKKKASDNGWAYTMRSEWEQKSGKTYTGSDDNGNTTKDIDISKVVAVGP